MVVVQRILLYVCGPVVNNCDILMNQLMIICSLRWFIIHFTEWQ